MKFIKIISLILVVAIMAACVVACGEGNNGETTSSTSSSTSSSTTPSKRTTTSSTTSSTTPPPPPAPPKNDVELYSNDFSASIDSDTSINSAAASLSNGKLLFANWGEAWNKTVTLNNATGEIIVSFVVHPNFYGGSHTILAINDVPVLDAVKGVGINIGGTEQRVDKLGASASTDISRNVTVTIDPATGDCTVEYAHPDGSQWGQVLTGTVNVGAISETIKVSVAVGVGSNGTRASYLIDDMKIAQVEE